MLVDSMDGLYYLASAAFDSDAPPVPATGGAAGIATAPEIATIATFSTWEMVDVTIVELPHEMNDVYPEAWDVIVVDEMTSTGPLHLLDMEFSPVGGRTAATSRGGRFGIRLLARSRERVRELGTTAAGDEVTEQHLIYIWPK